MVRGQLTARLNFTNVRLTAVKMRGDTVFTWLMTGCRECGAAGHYRPHSRRSTRRINSICMVARTIVLNPYRYVLQPSVSGLRRGGRSTKWIEAM